MGLDLEAIMVDRRWSERVQVSGPASVYYPPLGTLNGEIQDASIGGARIAVNNPPPINARVEVHISDKLRIPAYVVRESSSEMGIVFGNMSLESFRALRSTLMETVPA